MRFITPLFPVPFPLKGEGEISEKLGMCGSESTAHTQFFWFIPPPRKRGGGKRVRSKNMKEFTQAICY
jgi:hypothetical protein